MDERITGYDYLRILAAFSVVFIHVSYTNEFLSEYKIINNYAVPVFIMMSVFLFNKTLKIEWNRGVIKSFQRIAPQYFFWTLVYISLNWIKFLMLGGDFEITFSNLFLGTSAVQLWFLPALFFWQVFLIIIHRFETVPFFLFGIMILLFVNSVYLDSLEYGFLKLFLFHSPYIFIGRIIYLKKDFFKNINLDNLYRLLLILSLIGIYMFSVFSFKYSLSLIVYSISIFILFLRMRLSSCNKTFQFFSNSSFGIYLSHFGVYQLLIFIQQKLKIDSSNFNQTVVNIFLTFFISSILVSIMDKNKYLTKVI